MPDLEALFDVVGYFGDRFMVSRFGWGESVYLCYTQSGRDGFTVCRFLAAPMVLNRFPGFHAGRDPQKRNRPGHGQSLEFPNISPNS